MTVLKKVVANILLLALSLSVSAQNIKEQTVAVKTNVLYDAVTTMNIAVEKKFSPKWSGEFGVNYNPWKFDNRKQWKNWCMMPEARYWFCDVWDGHFVGGHIFGGQYNFGGIKCLPDFLGTKFSDLKRHRIQGWFLGAGVTYGYDWILSKHWNVEAQIGAGWAFTQYDRFRCFNCGKKIDDDATHHYFGPTKAALSVLYIF